MALLTRVQLIQRLGGDPSAAQLLDPNQTGTVDTDMLDSAISDAEGDVAAALGSRYLAISSNPSAKIVRIAGQLAVYYAWGRGPRNLTMPETVRQLYGAAKADLERIEASDSGPGGTPSSRFPTAIDVSAGGRRAVYSTWRRGGPNGSR